MSPPTALPKLAALGPLTDRPVFFLHPQNLSFSQAQAAAKQKGKGMNKREAIEQINVMARAMPGLFNAPYLEAKLKMELEDSFEVLPDSTRATMMLVIAALVRYQSDGRISGSMAQRAEQHLRTSLSAGATNGKEKP